MDHFILITLGKFISIVMNNKAFRNLFCNPQEFSHQFNNGIYKKKKKIRQAVGL